MTGPFETRNGTANTSHEQPSLKDRVRGLQLGDRLNGVKTRGSSSSWLPWMLCIVLATSWAGVGFRWYRATGGNLNAGNPGDSRPAAAAATNSTSAPAGDNSPVVLERQGLCHARASDLNQSDWCGRPNRETKHCRREGSQKGRCAGRARFDDLQGTTRGGNQTGGRNGGAYVELRENLQYEILQAESELAQAQAQLEEATILRDNARRTPIGANAKEDTDQKEKKYLAARANLQIQKAKKSQVTGESRQKRIEALHRDWEAAKARVKTAQWRLDNCEIKAPLTGIILSKKAEKFNLINPVVGGVSTSLCEMADLSDLEIELEIEERDIAKVEIGMECVIKTDAYPNRPYEGYVHRIMPIATRGKGILPVRIRIMVPKDEKQAEFLKPEMNSLVSIRSKKSKIWLAASAVSRLFGNGEVP